MNHPARLDPRLGREVAFVLAGPVRVTIGPRAGEPVVVLSQYDAEAGKWVEALRVWGDFDVDLLSGMAAVEVQER